LNVIRRLVSAYKRDPLGHSSRSKIDIL